MKTDSTAYDGTTISDTQPRKIWQWEKLEVRFDYDNDTSYRYILSVT